MSPSAERLVPTWPAEVRQHVEYKQEVAYRLLGDRLGVGGDPLAVRDKLIGGAPAIVKQTPEEVRDELGLAGKFTPEEWEKVKQAIARQEVEPKLTPAPTRYEHPKTYLLMNEIRLLIMEGAARIGQTIDFPPFLASLPSGDVNARISLPPGSAQPVFFFEQGLVQFLLDFAALAAWMAPPLPANNLGDATLAGIAPRHTMPLEASRLFQLSLSSYVANGNPTIGSALVPPPAHHAFLYELLFMRMMMFVFLHELEHLRKGHLAKPGAGRQEMWGHEFEADLAAASLVTRMGASRGTWGLNFWACDLVLIAFNFLDRTLAFFEFGDTRMSWISQTHPEPVARRKALFDRVGAGVPEIARAAAGNVYSMDEALFGQLWKISLSHLGLFVPERARGVRPSPIWSEKISRSFAPAA